MISDTQPLPAVTSEIASQRQGRISPLRATQLGDRSGQGAGAVQAPIDKAWAVALKVSVVITILSAVYYSPSVLEAVGNHLKSSEWNPSDIIKAVGTACILVVPTTCAIWWLLLHAMVNYPALMQEVMVVVVSLTYSAASSAFTGGGFVLNAFTFSCASFVFVVYAFLQRGERRLNASKFKAAALTVRSTPNIKCWTLCVMAIRVAWLVVAFSAAIGPLVIVLLERGADGSTDPAGSCYSISLVFFWIWNAAWHFSVIVNVVDATVARSVTSCYSSPDNVEDMWGSFGEAMHSSLGSLCRAAVLDSACALIMSCHVLPTICNVATCPMLCTPSIGTSVLLCVVPIVLALRGGYVKGPSICFFLVVFSVVTLMSSSPPSFNTARTICSWGVLPGIVATMEVMIYARNAVHVCFAQDPRAF